VQAIDAIGARFLGMLRYLWFLIAFGYLATKMLWVGRRLGQRDLIAQVLTQVYFTAVQAIGPVAVVALGVGGLAMIQGLGGVGALSDADSVGRLITVVVIREVAPLFTCVMVIARSATAIAAELGLMRVNREIEALEVMGIPPIRQLVTPRLLGGLISVAALAGLFAAIALCGGFALAWLTVNLPAQVFFDATLAATRPRDLAAFVIKVAGGGAGIVLVACFHGLDVKEAPSEVPVAVSRAALNALILVVALHAAVSLWTFVPEGVLAAVWTGAR